jgi:hypothetical protein
MSSKAINYILLWFVITVEKESNTVVLIPTTEAWQVDDGKKELPKHSASLSPIFKK